MYRVSVVFERLQYRGAVSATMAPVNSAVDSFRSHERTEGAEAEEEAAVQVCVMSHCKAAVHSVTM